MVIAIIGTLVALLLPAVQAAREAARRTTCENRLRQIGLGLVNYSGRSGAFPIGCIDCANPAPSLPRKRTSWVIWTLPYLEEQTLFDRFETSLPVNHPTNRPAASAVLPLLTCPSVTGDAVSQRGAYTDYGGLYGVEGAGFAAIPPEWHGVLVYEEAVTLQQVTDGLSKTLVVAEMHLRRLEGECEWAYGTHLFAQESETRVNPPSTPASEAGLANEIGSVHPGGALAVRCDSGVEFLSDSIEPAALRAWLTRAGGEL